MDKRFGKKLRAIRRERGMAQVDLAGPMDWSTPYLSNIETGRSDPPSVERIEQLVRILGAEDQLPELLELAAHRRGKLVFPIEDCRSPEVVLTLMEIWAAFRGGRFDESTARRVRDVLQVDTAAA